MGLALVLGDVGTRIIRGTIALGGLTAILSSLLAQQTEGRRTGGVSTALSEANIPTDPVAAATALGAEALTSLGPLLLEVDIGEAPAETLAAVEQEIAETVLPRQFYTDTITALQRVKDNFEDSVGFKQCFI